MGGLDHDDADVTTQAADALAGFDAPVFNGNAARRELNGGGEKKLSTHAEQEMN